MIDGVIIFGIGFFVGGLAGVVLMALMAIKRGDDE